MEEKKSLVKTNERYFWIPIICFRNWTFSQFYTYFYLSKFRNSKNFVRINNFIGRKNDPMKINRSTFFNARKFLEEIGAIRVIHPKQGINSGSKTDAIINSFFLKFERGIASLPITHNFLESISDKTTWKEARLKVLKFYFENFWVGREISFNRWLSRDIFCPFTEKTIPGKSSNYSVIKKIESADFDFSKIIFNHKAYLGKNKKASTKPDSSKKILSENQKEIANPHRQNKTVNVSSDKLIVKQVNGVGESCSKSVSNFTFYNGEYELLKTGFSRVLDADSLHDFSESEKHLLMAFVSLCRNKLQKLSDTVSIFDLIRIIIGNYYCIISSNVPTKTNFTNRLLRSVEFNFSVGLFNEFLSKMRNKALSDDSFENVLLSVSKNKVEPSKGDEPVILENTCSLYEKYRNTIGEFLAPGFTSFNRESQQNYVEEIYELISGFDTERSLVRYIEKNIGVKTGETFGAFVCDKYDFARNL